jgi:hypothetical protein
MNGSLGVASLVLFFLPAPVAAQAANAKGGSPVEVASSGGAAEPVQSFHDLALRIRPGHQVRIEDQAGASMTGRLTRLTPNEITIENEDGERLFASQDVRTVSRRHGSARWGALIGAGALATLGAISECRGGEDKYCGEGVGMGLIFGAGLGACAGALILRTTTVYGAGEKQAFLSPVLSRHAVGVHAGLSW